MLRRSALPAPAAAGPAGHAAPARAADPAGPAEPVAAQRPWPVRRIFPLLATVGLVIFGMISTTWGPHLLGRSAWALPDDLWATLTAASRLAHLNLSGLYTQPTGLVSFPGTAVILIPAAVIADAAGFSLQFQNAQNPDPTVWLLAGPYEIALSGVALFAADAIAERMGATLWKRALLAAAGVVALWSVSVRWGHPEDAVAMGLFLYGILALSGSRTSRSAWLTGAAVAVQPLVLLALPVILAVIEPRRVIGFLLRAAAPSVLLLGAAVAANPGATFTAVTKQPNSAQINHPTLWTSLSPHMSNGLVVAGPARLLAILIACGCALVVYRRLSAARQQDRWSPQALSELLWWVAVTLALRCVFEPVMVSYYLWPALAAALISASLSWSRLVPTAVAVAGLTLFSQIWWHGAWSWWVPMIAVLGLTLYLARPPFPARSPAVRPDISLDLYKSLLAF